MPTGKRNRANWGSAVVVRGLRTDKAFALTDAILTSRGRAAWAHDFDPNRAIAATASSHPSISCRSRSALLSRSRSSKDRRWAA
jgi:uncharacterized protein with beta-barrel porin domain